MANYLVIVESPTKVTSIKKFLGSRYKVMASQGHVRDLPKSQLGIDVEHDYEPKYITIRGKGDLLAKLRKEAAKAIPMGRMTETSDIVPAMVYLLSDISSMVTATEFKVNGGELI